MSTAFEAEKRHVPPVIGHMKDVVVDHAAGSWVYDVDGGKYLDFTSSCAVTNTGHCHPKVVAAAQAQTERLIHGFQNLYWHQPMLELTGKLMELMPGGLDRVIYSNTGAEATEGAVKLAKQVTGRTAIVCFEGAYHGRTHLTMPMTCCKVHFRGHYDPLVGGVYHVPFPDPFRMPGVDAIDWCLSRLDLLFRREVYPDDVAAIVVEPVQGEGGSLVAPPEFMRGLRRGVRRARYRARLLRAADGIRSHRRVLRQRALRCRARRDHAGQGHGVRLPALGSRGPRLTHGQVGEGQPRRRVQRQRRVVRRRRRHDRRHHRRRHARQLRAAGRAVPGLPPRAAGAAIRSSATFVGSGS